MSLLMEALKKAEEARRKAGEGASAPETLETMTMASLASGREADAPADRAGAIQDISPRRDADPATAPGHTHLAGRLEEERLGARALFAAKHSPRTGSLFWPLVGGVGILALLGAVGYFLWQWQAIPPPLAAAPPLATPVPPPVPSTDPANTLSAPPAAPLAAPSAEEGGVRRAALPPKAAPSAPFAATAGLPERAPAPASARPGKERREREGREERKAAALRLTRSSAPTHTLLESAYEALQSGRDEEALRAYAEALRADGRNTDALLGLATLAARQGQDEDAHGYYLRALEADPNDATARAGVLGAARPGGDEAAESRLKTLLSGQPGAPPLHFALGNLYARQQRWSEAQQAYFRAYAGEPGNPDLIFNLAVSLDHLRKGPLAARYYHMALEAADARTAAFDRDEAKARLLELSR